MTDNEVSKAVIILSKRQNFAKFAVGAVVGYFASELAEKGYEMAVAAIRSRKSA